VTLYTILFYLIAGIIVAATGLAVTRRNPIHSVVCLTISFLGTAMLFYLLGAPFLSALEVIIYAGAIMVLILFVIMMIRMEGAQEGGLLSRRFWIPGALSAFVAAVLGVVVLSDPGWRTQLEAASAAPRAFGGFVFEKYWFPVEIISLLLLVALVAAVQLGRGKGEEKDER
jgi:NADH-quinone oxidoreductase subunit J